MTLAQQMNKITGMRAFEVLACFSAGCGGGSSRRTERFASAPALLDRVLSYLAAAPAGHRHWEITVRAGAKPVSCLFVPGLDPERVDEVCGLLWAAAA